MKPQSVFVLSAGEYSDWHIIAIYSSRAKAEVAKRQYNEKYSDAGWSYKADFSEYALDEPLDELYRVYCYRYADGKILYGAEEGSPNEPPNLNWPHTTSWCIAGYGKSKEHARRSAEQLLREKRAIGEIA